MKNIQVKKNSGRFPRFRGLDLSRPMGTAIGAGLLALTVGFIYWPVVKYPFIQDDWCILNSLVKDGIPGFLTNAFVSYQTKFYRPVSQLIIALLYDTFGLNPVGYHTVALILHALNSFLVVRIARRCIGTGFSAWIVGFLYAAAATVQMDPVFWTVGINDLCASLFFFLAVLFFFRNNTPATFACFLLGLLSKESVIILPLILFILLLFRGDENRSWGHRIENSLRSLVWYIVLTALYLAFRSYGIRAEGANLGVQYQIGFFGIHIVKNLLYYAEWFAESVTCTGHLPIALVLVFWLVPCAAVAFSWKRKPERIHFIVFFLWAFLGILPVIFLIDHPFRYYLVYSLPALLMILVTSLEVIARWFSLRERYVKSFLGLATAVVMCGSAVYILTLDRQGFVGTETIQGSNNLLRKGALISTVQDDLFKDAPVLPPGAVVVFDWMPIGSFCGDAAIQIWYHDYSLKVLTIDQLHFDSAGAYVAGTLSPDQPRTTGDKSYFDPQKLFIFKIWRGHYYLQKLSHYLPHTG